MEKLYSKFKDKIAPALLKELGKKNVMEVPFVQKVVVSIGTGDHKEDKGAIEKISGELAKITGQKPKVNLSKKAVSAFKLRIGQPVGLTVTLRGERMYDFIDRLVNVAMPRIRDFRGLSFKAFDGQGNYSIGVKDYTIFPEIKYEDVSFSFGLEINLKIKAQKVEDAKALLLALGFPFEKNAKINVAATSEAKE